MNWLYVLLFSVLPIGQLGAMNIWIGVTVYIHDIVILCILIASIIKKRSQKINPELQKPITVFLAIGVLSLTMNSVWLPLSWMLVSWLYLLRLVGYLCLYFVVLRSEKNSFWWLTGLFMAGIIFSTFGIIQYTLYPDLRELTFLGWDPHFYRLTSTFFDPNFAGIYIVLTILLSIIVLKKYSIVLVSTFCVLMIVLFLTYSRSSYVAFFGAITLWMFITKAWKLVSVIIFFTLIIVFAPKNKLDVTDIFRYTTSVARVENWKKSLAYVSKSPVFGVGYNTLVYKNPFKKTDMSQTPNHSTGGIDSSLLVVLVTTGIVGFGAFIWIVVKIIQIGIRTCGHNIHHDYGVLLITTISAILIHSLFNNSFFYPWILIWLMIVLGSAEKSLTQKPGKTRDDR